LTLEFPIPKYEGGEKKDEKLKQKVVLLGIKQGAEKWIVGLGLS
jgi:hypothetical protein